MSETKNDFMELQSQLLESIEHQIHWLNGIRNDIKAGTYTREQAGLDYENAINTEGFDWLSTLMELSENA